MPVIFLSAQKTSSKKKYHDWAQKKSLKAYYLNHHVNSVLSGKECIIVEL